MKAIVFTIYGPPDVLHLEEVPKPAVKDDEVLIKIPAATSDRSESLTKYVRLDRVAVPEIGAKQCLDNVALQAVAGP